MKMCCCTLFKICKNKMERDSVDSAGTNVALTITCCASQGNNTNAVGN